MVDGEKCLGMVSSCFCCDWVMDSRWMSFGVGLGNFCVF